jgi:hypothetical protein
MGSVPNLLGRPSRINWSVKKEAEMLITSLTMLAYAAIRLLIPLLILIAIAELRRREGGLPLFL